jgi:hypothetical protein
MYINPTLNKDYLLTFLLKVRPDAPEGLVSNVTLITYVVSSLFLITEMRFSSSYWKRDHTLELHMYQIIHSGDHYFSIVYINRLANLLTSNVICYYFCLPNYIFISITLVKKDRH